MPNNPSPTGTKEFPFRTYTRRAVVASLLKGAACTSFGSSVTLTALAHSFGALSQRRSGMMQISGPFQRQFRVPAMSVALSRNGHFVYDHAGGMADRQHVTQAQQNNLFRIADLSQSITAVTIFSLVEASKLNLTDHVFGSGGILGTKFGKPPYKPYVTDITVDHLLCHTAGG